MRYTTELINQGLRLYFEDQHDFEDCPNSRAIIQKKINDDFGGDFSTYNIQQAAKACKAQLRPAESVAPAKQRREIYWSPTTQQQMLEAAGKRLGWTPLATNENINAILSLLQKVGADVSEENVFVACESLGRSALAHNAPVPTPPPPPAPRPARFDWEVYVREGLELPLDREVPASVLQRCTLAQVKSLVARRDRALKPWLNQNGFRDQGMRGR
jgi:hypothetical protein